MLSQSLPSSDSFDLSDLSVASSHSHQIARDSSHFYPFFSDWLESRWRLSKFGFTAPFERVFMHTKQYGRYSPPCWIAINPNLMYSGLYIGFDIFVKDKIN